MKLQILSDYHLEFSPTTKIRNVGSDLLVMAGDITTVKDLVKEDFYNIDFFEYISKEFKDIIYVLGNHEHYNYTFDYSAIDLKKSLEKYPNIHVLNNEFVIIDGVKFIGSTLWTDMNNRCPITIETLRHGMNDFRLIKTTNGVTYHKFNPQDALVEHIMAKRFIREHADLHEKCIVVTHHAPSYRSIHPKKYKNDKYMNGGYASNLEDMMIDNIKVWIHGHIHSPSDYIVNNTRVVCNPHGYRNEGVEYNGNLVIEI